MKRLIKSDNISLTNAFASGIVPRHFFLFNTMTPSHVEIRTIDLGSPEEAARRRSGLRLQEHHAPHDSRLDGNRVIFGYPTMLAGYWEGRLDRLGLLDSGALDSEA